MAIAHELGHPRLQQDLLALDEAAKKAFFINLYNIMTFHGILVYGRRSGLWNLYCFFIAPAVSYFLAGVPVSLDDVENGFLRAQPHYFQQTEQALQLQLQASKLDPRIHMALNCGARGCPAIGVYSSEADALDRELDDAVVGFVADDDNVKVTGSKLEVTELFKMYFTDFAGLGAKPGKKEDQLALARWILPFTRGAKRASLEGVLGDARFQLEWKSYNWATNGPDMPLYNRIYKPTW